MSKLRSPSIKTVAEKAGVSVATVSNVLNGKPNVLPEFAKRVNDAVKELGYVVDMGASRMRSGKAQLIGVVVPDLTNPMFAAFVSTLEHAARLDGFDLVVVSARNNAAEEADRLKNIRSWRPSGLIVIPCDGAVAHRLPQGFHAPVVLADRIPDKAGFDMIAVDNATAAGAVASHLDAQGYRDCFVVGTSLAISNVRERWEGIRATAKTTKLDILEIGIDDIHGTQRLERRLRQRPLPQALFSLDQGTTLLTYRMIVELGLSIPGDLAFASFDEMEWMRLVAPGITTVRQPVEEMAEQAWALLLRRIKGWAEGPVTRRLRCAVEIRGSTLRCPLEEADCNTTGGSKWKRLDEPYSPE